MLTVHVLIVAIDSESSILRTHLATRGLSVGRLLRGRENPRGRPSAEVASLGTACDSERDGHRWAIQKPLRGKTIRWRGWERAGERGTSGRRRWRMSSAHHPALRTDSGYGGRSDRTGRSPGVTLPVTSSQLRPTLGDAARGRMGFWCGRFAEDMACTCTARRDVGRYDTHGESLGDGVGGRDASERRTWQFLCPAWACGLGRLYRRCAVATARRAVAARLRSRPRAPIARPDAEPAARR